MKMRTICALVWCVAIPARADLLVAPATKGTLNVEYTYEASGRTQDQNDTHEWRVKRVVKMTAQLAAGAASELPTVRPISAAQTADLQSMQTRATNSTQQATQKMAPMMGDMQAIMAKCGDDEACIEKAVASYGMSMGVTPEMESAKHDIADVAAATKPGAPRYQAWRGTAQKGTYSIDETIHRLDADPICKDLHCTTDTSAKGAGEVTLPPGVKDPAAAAGISAVEIDSVGKTLFIRLPVPLNGLSYSETVITNSPEREAGTTTKQIRFPGELKPVDAAIKGDLRDQSGQEVIKLSGQAEEGGTLTIRWRFSAQ